MRPRRATPRKAQTLSIWDPLAEDFLAAKLHATSDSNIKAAFQNTRSEFGHVDVIAPNAEYGPAGPFEGLTDAQARRQMHVYLIGLTEVTRKAICKQRPSSERMQQVTSMALHHSWPVFSPYCASNWAVEGFTEPFAGHLKPEWNIKYICAEPGGFRNNRASSSTNIPAEKLPAYNHLDAKAIMART